MRRKQHGIDGSFGYIPQISVYLAALIGLTVGIIQGDYVIVWALFGLYLVYDMAFFFQRRRFEGRDVKMVLEDLRAACGYMAYFFPIAAILMTLADYEKIGFIFDEEPEILLMPVIGLLAAAVATLFIPVQYCVGDRCGNSPSWALRLCYVFVLFLQKVAVTSFSFAILRAMIIASELSFCTKGYPC